MVDKYNAENAINRHNSRGRVANGRLVDIDVVFDENISEFEKYAVFAFFLSSNSLF